MLSISPAVVVKLTVVPSATLLPVVSSTVAEISVWEMPSAKILAEPDVTDTEPIEASISVILTVFEIPLVASAVTVSVPAVSEAV